jgi:hypothetical protein
MRGENRHQHDGKAHVCDGLADLDCWWGNLVFAFRKRIRDLSDLYPGSGLTVDAPIEFHGVDVGKVKNIRLVSPRSVSIVLSVDKSAPLTSATVATITSRGLATRGCTGYVYISLDDVGIDSRPLAMPGNESLSGLAGGVDTDRAGYQSLCDLRDIGRIGPMRGT